QYYNIVGQMSGEFVEGYVMGDPFDQMGYYKGFDNLLRPSSLSLNQFQGKGQIHELTYTYDAASRLNKIKQLNAQEEFTYNYVPDSNLIESVTYQNTTGNE